MHISTEQDCPKQKKLNASFLKLFSYGISKSAQEAAQPHIWLAPCRQTDGSHRFRVQRIVGVNYVIPENWSLSCVCVRELSGLCTDSCQALTQHIFRLRDEMLKASWGCRVHRVIRFTGVHYPSTVVNVNCERLEKAKCVCCILILLCPGRIDSRQHIHYLPSFSVTLWQMLGKLKSCHSCLGMDRKPHSSLSLCCVIQLWNDCIMVCSARFTLVQAHLLCKPPLFHMLLPGCLCCKHLADNSVTQCHP